MTKREWKKKIYRGMAVELHQQAFDLGAEWLTLDADGELLSEAEEGRMKVAVTEEKEGEINIFPTCGEATFGGEIE